MKKMPESDPHTYRSYVPFIRTSGRLLAALSVLYIALVGANANAAATKLGEIAEGELTASIASGGRLYDNWMRELTEKAPKKAHPLYPKQSSFADNPEKTWRCATCHGYDYKGVNGAYHTGVYFTAIKGIDGKAGAPIADIVKIISNEDHGYAEYLDDDDIFDLANFVSHGQIETQRYIDPANGFARGRPELGDSIYSTICTACHGTDGRSMDTIDPIGAIARKDPWEAFHKMLHGHPGGSMPALKAFPIQTVTSILAKVQSLPALDPLASIARGGKLYDGWSKEIGYPYPKDKHPAFPKGKTVEEGSSTWRCVECHGWDYKGANGIKGIRDMAGARPSDILSVLTDDTHELDRFLKYRGLIDLTNFVGRGQVEMNEYINPETKEARGKSNLDQGLFLTICATCHGDEGYDIRTMLPMGRESNEDPWKTLHKTLHGHPGEYMPAWQFSVTPEKVKNILAIMQTLPKSRR